MTARQRSEINLALFLISLSTQGQIMPLLYVEKPKKEHPEI